MSLFSAQNLTFPLSQPFSLLFLSESYLPAFSAIVSPFLLRTLPSFYLNYCLSFPLKTLPSHFLNHCLSFPLRIIPSLYLPFCLSCSLWILPSLFLSYRFSFPLRILYISSLSHLPFIYFYSIYCIKVLDETYFFWRLFSF